MKISLCHLPLPSASVGDLDLKWARVILTSGCPVCHHLGGRWDEDQLSRVGTRRESGMLSSQHCPLGDTVQSQSSGRIPETWVWAGSIPFKCPSPIHSTILALKILWTKEPSRATVYGFSRSQTWLSDWAGRSTLHSQISTLSPDIELNIEPRWAALKQDGPELAPVQVTACAWGGSGTLVRVQNH